MTKSLIRSRTLLFDPMHRDGPADGDELHSDFRSKTEAGCSKHLIGSL